MNYQIKTLIDWLISEGTQNSYFFRIVDTLSVEVGERYVFFVRKTLWIGGKTSKNNPACINVCKRLKGGRCVCGLPPKCFLTLCPREGIKKIDFLRTCP